MAIKKFDLLLKVLIIISAFYIGSVLFFDLYILNANFFIGVAKSVMF